MRKDKHVAPYFEGVFASDTLPHRLHKKPALLISNLDPISKPGSHWVALFINKNGEGEFWDSYGMPPIVLSHRTFLNRHCKKWTYNHTSLQAINSKVCGEYCMLYLIHRAHGYSLQRFVNMYFYQNDANKNDRIVRTLFRRMFGRKKMSCALSGPSQSCCERKR